MDAATLDLEKSPERMLRQAASFALHVFISLLVYATLFFLCSFLNTSNWPGDWPAIVATLLVTFVPFGVAYLIHLRGEPTSAPFIWIAGVVWLLMVTVYVLELPTGPGKCEHCTAVSKIWLTLFDLTTDSNLVEGAGRVIGTWPALAMIGYSVGARFVLQRRFRDTEVVAV
jgi:hypothetical protein